jgi:putative transcriptional regulator
LHSAKNPQNPSFCLKKKLRVATYLSSSGGLPSYESSYFIEGAAGVPTMKTKEISFDAEALVASVEAMADHVRGERKLTLRKRALLPSPAKPLAAQDVVEIRQRLNVSQAVFASLLNVSKVTAISWEKGRRRPSGAALRLLDLVCRRPEVFQEV